METCRKVKKPVLINKEQVFLFADFAYIYTYIPGTKYSTLKKRLHTGIKT